MPQHQRTPLLLLVLVSAVAALPLTGCAGRQERVCSPGRDPVLAVNDSGSDCIPSDEEPAPGWARYPQGKVPVHLDDKWDRYWADKTLDQHGRVVPLPR
ncbi:SCO0607 family lipoprotein [Streptomyces sp. NPDC015220]|uniref:SCO0607 family lipoprotein n=1 Tax=Streptomyces sp. NPDC015220 TaxID=3364947 RepID=UPI0037023765